MSEDAHLYVAEGTGGEVGRLEPLHVHALPVAPTFIGREGELKALDEFWRHGTGVMSLVGLGGAGKTAVLERFLREVGKEDPPDGILVWSFYDDPDTNAFLQSAFSYITGGQVADAK